MDRNRPSRKLGQINGSVAKIDFDAKSVIRNGLIEPFNNWKFIDFGVFATEPSCRVKLNTGQTSFKTPVNKRSRLETAQQLIPRTIWI